MNWFTNTALLPWWAWLLVGAGAWIAGNGMYVWYMARASRPRRWKR